MKGALIGAILSSSCYAADKAGQIDVSFGIKNSSSTIEESSASDTSPVMNVKSKDKLKTDKLCLELKVKTLLADIFALSFEDNLIRQTGYLTRDSQVFEVINVLETGDYAKSRNIIKALIGTKKFGIGVSSLKENEKRVFTQHTAYLDNNVLTKQSSQLFGPLARLHLERKGDINLEFNTDFSYFSDGNEKYMLEFENFIPGDPKFERSRKVRSFLSESSAEIGIPTDGLISLFGIKGKTDYFSKKVKQDSTTEKYMPVYENYTDTRIDYALEAFAELGKHLRFTLGAEQEHHKSRGSLEIENKNYTRLYGGAEIRLNFK